jgi:hypothetical protein
MLYRAVITALLVALVATLARAEDSYEDQLRRALTVGDLERAEAAILELHRIGGTRRIQFVFSCLAAVPPKQEIIYWLLVRGATGFGDRAALSALGDFIVANRGNPLSRDLMFGIQGNRSSPAAECLIKVLHKGPPDLARMAAEQLANIHETDTVEALVTALAKQRSRGVREAIAQSLEIITAQTFGTDDELWTSWWAGARSEGVKKTDDGYIVRGSDDDYQLEAREVLKESGRVLVLTLICPARPEAPMAYDAIENVISPEGIPVDVMDKMQFEETLPDLSPYMAICMNCTQLRPHCHCPFCKPGPSDSGWRMHPCTGCDKHDVYAHRLGERGIGHIKKFVQRGGYLFTEDWNLIEVLEVAWPKIVGTWPKLVEDPRLGKLLGTEKLLPEMDVDVNPVRGITSHPFLRGVYAFHRGAEDLGSFSVEEEGQTAVVDLRQRIGALRHQWHIDDESPAIVIRNQKVVTVLLQSQKLAGLTDGNNACAITFFPGKGRGKREPVVTDYDGTEYGPGKGRVLHILSHFGKQENIADEDALRNLLFNFLREAAVVYNLTHKRKQ